MSTQQPHTCLKDIHTKAAAPIFPDDPECGTYDTVASAAKILMSVNDDEPAPPTLCAPEQRPR